MTQPDPYTLYTIAIVFGFVVYVIAMVAVYLKNRKASKPSTIIETKGPEAPQHPTPLKKGADSSTDQSSVLLKEINEKLSNIDAIAKFTKARSLADRLAESQEKTDEIDPIRAKIVKTLRTRPSGESTQTEDSEPESIAERTEELA
jgi:hypothetical protein